MSVIQLRDIIGQVKLNTLYVQIGVAFIQLRDIIDQVIFNRLIGLSVIQLKDFIDKLIFDRLIGVLYKLSKTKCQSYSLEIS